MKTPSSNMVSEAILDLRAQVLRYLEYSQTANVFLHIVTKSNQVPAALCNSVLYLKL